MDKSDPGSDLSVRVSEGAAIEAAQLVKRDFDALLQVFEGELASLPPEEVQRRAHIIEAKLAAERGLELSNKLISMLEN